MYSWSASVILTTVTVVSSTEHKTKGMSVRAAAAGIAADFSMCILTVSSGVLGDAVVLLVVKNDVIIPSSTTMWLISSFCVVPLYQLTRFRRLQCLFSVCYCVLNYDQKSADNVCLQMAADCQAPFTRYNLLSNRLYNRYDNRLYRVNGVSETTAA